jgi:hypothetical protein
VLQVKQEWEVHASLSHPNIIQAYLGMEDSSGVKLFMEYAGDSDAYSYINAKQRLSLREDDARQLVYDVLTALQYMHSQVCGGWGCCAHCLVYWGPQLLVDTEATWVHLSRAFKALQCSQPLMCGFQQLPGGLPDQSKQQVTPLPHAATLRLPLCVPRLLRPGHRAP